MERHVQRIDAEARLTHPDWVVFGITQGDGVWVYASTSMTYAELRYEAEVERDLLGLTVFDRVEPRNHTFTLTAVTKNYLVVHGATYAEAMERLMNQWQPGGNLALPGGG